MVQAGNIQKQRTWKARLARHRRSGLSVTRFCEQERVSTHSFYYWAKRFRATAAESRSSGSLAAPSRSVLAVATTSRDPQGAVVRFRLKTGIEISVPADCLEAVRCLAKCLAEGYGRHAGAFQEVVVKA